MESPRNKAVAPQNPFFTGERQAPSMVPRLFVAERLWERHVWLCQIRLRPSGDHKGLHMPSSSLDGVKIPSTIDFC